MGSRKRLPYKNPIVVFEGIKYYLTPRGTPFYYRSREGKRLHREVARRFFGEIPKGYHVHHRDGDIANNAPSNLELLSPSEHYRQHSQRTEKICLECGKSFGALLRKHQRFCSQKCGTLYRAKEKTKQIHLELKTCELCGSIFNQRRSDARYCSKKCQTRSCQIRLILRKSHFHR